MSYKYSYAVTFIPYTAATVHTELKKETKHTFKTINFNNEIIFLSKKSIYRIEQSRICFYWY